MWPTGIHNYILLNLIWINVMGLMGLISIKLSCNGPNIRNCNSAHTDIKIQNSNVRIKINSKDGFKFILDLFKQNQKSTLWGSCNYSVIYWMDYEVDLKIKQLYSKWFLGVHSFINDKVAVIFLLNTSTTYTKIIIIILFYTIYSDGSLLVSAWLRGQTM
jgi:hypothetical protein